MPAPKSTTMTNTWVMLMTWNPSPGTVVKSAIGRSETNTESVIVTSGTIAMSGDR